MRRKRLLIVLAVICIAIAAAAVLLPGESKVEWEDHFRKVAAVDPRIENVSCEGYTDLGSYKVITVSFTIRDKPNSRVILIPDGESDLNSLRVLQVGVLSPVLFEWDDHAKAWSPRPPTLGSNAKYRPPHPWKDMDLKEFVLRYDEVVGYFSKWPTAPKTEEMTTDGGIVVECRVDPADASTMKAFTPPGD